MNILYLAVNDWAGVGNKLFSAFNGRYGKDGHQAHQIAYNSFSTAYPCDIFQPSDDTLRKLIHWADVIHVFDSWNRWVPYIGKRRLVVTYNGTQYRKGHESMNELDRDRGNIQLCTTIDLTKFGPTWSPVPMEDHGFRLNPPDRPFRIAHSPTNRIKKNTRFILLEIGKLGSGVEVDLIERVLNVECIRRKSLCHILVNQMDWGYGINALESFKMGQPVLSGVEQPGLLDLFLSYIGYLPFVRVRKSDLMKVMARLKDDEIEREKAGALGLQYVNDFHHPDRVAEFHFSIYEQLLEG